MGVEDWKMSLPWVKGEKTAQTVREKSKEAALDKAAEENLLGEAFSIDLAGFAEGDTFNKYLPGNLGNKLWRQMIWVGSTPMREGERAVRRVTFRAVWENAMKALEKGTLTEKESDWFDWLKSRYEKQIGDLLQEGFNPHEALAYVAGKEAVRMTSGEFARWNRPQLLRGKWTGLVFYTKNFWFQRFRMLNPVAHRPYRQVWYDNNGDLHVKSLRNPMYRAAIDNLVIQLALAGAAGLPFAEYAIDIMDALLYWAKKHGLTSFEVGEKKVGLIEDSVQGAVRRYLNGFDPDAADYFLHGLGYSTFGLYGLAKRLGLGEYVPEVNLSQNISMGGPLPGASTEAFKRWMVSDGTGADLIMDVGGELAGLTFSTIKNIAKALINDSPISTFSLHDFGMDPGGWMKAHGGTLPTEIRQAVMAGINAKIGGEPLEGGGMLPYNREPIEFDWTRPKDALEMALRATGAMPTKLSRAYEQKDDIAQSTMYWGARQKLLLSLRNHVLQVGDDERLVDYLEAKARFNAEVPFSDMQITPKGEEASWKAHFEGVKESSMGVPRGKAGEALLQMNLQDKYISQEREKFPERK